MISSSIPGRLRLRDDRFRDLTEVERLRQRLADLEGSPAVTANPRTGSVLVTYSPSLVDDVELFTALDEHARPAPPRANGSSGPTLRLLLPQRALELGIVGSLGVSLGAAVVGLKSVHIAAGVAFVALAGVHIQRAGGIARWRRAREQGA